MKIEREHASERLAYRALCPKDVSLVFNLHSFPEVAKYNTIGLPKNETETTKILSKRLDTSDKLNMGWIIYNHANQFVGEVGFVLAPKRFHKAEISYSLLPSFWNNGYATEMVTHFIRFAFNDLQLHRLEAGVAINNKASIRVLEKCGMKREGQHRKILPLADGWSDSFSYAILKDKIGND